MLKKANATQFVTPTTAVEREQCAALGLEGDLESPSLAHVEAVDDEDMAALQAQLEEIAVLEVYREEIRRAEALALDEAVARSLYAREERKLLSGGETGSSSDSEEDSMIVASPSSWLEESKPAPSCTCCLGRLEDEKARWMLPCGHLYCKLCVAMRCGMAVRDRSMLPAHCCKKEFPIDYVRDVLKTAEAQAYERFLKEKDWTTLDLESDREYAVVVQAVGGRQCPGCGVGVYRIDGCSRMKCNNGHEFCYTCGGKWKTCVCAYP